MWKVGGLKIVTAASRRIILPGWHRNWWKSAFFYKTLRTRKFSTGKFFEGSTHGNLTHSRFRICVLKGSATHFRPCYSCPCDFEGPKSRLHNKISWMSAGDHIITSNYRRPMDAILFPKPTFVQNSGLDARKDHKHDKSFHYLCHCTPLKYVQTL